MTTSSAMTSSSSDDVFGAYTRLSSSIATYNFPTIAVVMTDATGGIDTAAVDIQVSGLTTRDSRYAATSEYQRAIAIGNAGAVCEGLDADFDWVAAGMLNAATKDFTSESISPTDVVKRGPSSNTVTISVKATTSAAIPDNGEIVLNLKNGEWEFTASTVCTCSALVANAAGTAMVNSNPTTGRTLTMNGFGAVSSGTALDITCTYVLVSNDATGTTTLVDTLYSLDGASGNQINKWAGSSNTVTVT